MNIRDNKREGSEEKTKTRGEVTIRTERMLMSKGKIRGRVRAWGKIKVDHRKSEHEREKIK